MDTERLFLEGNALYDKGEFNKAFAVFMQAATQGDTSSMIRVASMYTCGEGVECDYDKAIEWELKAADHGNLTALINLGISYRIKGDIRLSKSWFEKALTAGDPSAAIELAKLYRVSDKEVDTVVAYLNTALENHNALSDGEIEEARSLLAEMQTVASNNTGHN